MTPVTSDLDNLRQLILSQVAEYYQMAHADRSFAAGKTRVRYASRVYDERELMSAVDAVLDFWLTAGPRAAAMPGVKPG